MTVLHTQPGTASLWQPIDSAPKDKNVIVWDDGVMGEAYFDGEDETWWWSQTSRHDYHARQIYPSLWHPMPLPPPPEAI